jgi:hypothetical protein
MSIKAFASFAVPALVLMAFLVWRVQSMRFAELENLHRSAFFGDHDALTRLASFNNPHANGLLRDLLLNNQSLADARITVFALRSHGALTDGETARLLDLQGSPSARHAAAAAFQKDGCMVDCVRASLDELRALWSGEKTSEEKKILASAFTKDALQLAGPIAERAHIETENEALLLVKSNPCEAERQLKSMTGEKDTFINMLKAKITLAQSCGK